MISTRSWQFVGRHESAANRLYEWLRRRVNRSLVRFLCRHLSPLGKPGDASSLKLPARLAVLEAGSGTAFAASQFARRPEVSISVCMDLDSDALVEARKRDPTLSAVVGDLARMPFVDHAFSLVFNNSTVEHLEDPGTAVCEMQRVTHPEGRVFVGLPYLWGPLVFQRLICKTALGIWLGTVFSRAALDRLLRSADLVPIAHRRFFLNVFIGAIAAKVDQSGGKAGTTEAPC